MGGGGGRDGGGPWGLVSKGRGYEFDNWARLEISTTTPSSIFSKFSPKISKSVDCTGVFYCLEWRPGQNKNKTCESKYLAFSWSMSRS